MYASGGPSRSSSNLRPMTGAASVSNTNVLSTNAPTSDTNLSGLEHAKAAVKANLVSDETAVAELENILPAASSHYTETPSEAWEPFYTSKYLDVPSAVLAEFESLVQCNSSMGLFAEIDRAWIVINNKLILWDYSNGADYNAYDDSTENINSVSLVKAKKGVFIDSITHLFIICTDNTVQAVGVAAPPTLLPNGSTRRELSLFATDIEVKTEGIPMFGVVGTAEGRIFMYGGKQDGSLYELTYQEKEGWFSKKCSLVNHSVNAVANFIPNLLATKSADPIIDLVVDDDRRCLYARTALNHIILYHIPLSSPNTVTRISCVEQLAQKAQSLCPGSPLLDSRSFDIESFHVIRPTESKGVHLLAVTINGVRLYFTHGRGGLRGYTYQTSSAQPAVPSHLSLIHVRTPPTSLPDPRDLAYPTINPQTGLPTPPQPWTVRKVGSAAYCNGLFVATQNEDENSVLLCAAPDVPKLAGLYEGSANQTAYQSQTPKVLTEMANLIMVSGAVWAVAVNPAMPNSVTGLAWNETVTQSTGSPQSFLILTNKGLYVIVKRRPVNTLMELCDNFMKTRDDNPLGVFSSTWGWRQSATMALSIAAGNTYLGSDIELSSVAKVSSAASALSLNPVNEHMADVARMFFSHMGGKPTMVEQRAYISSEHNALQYNPSNRHDSLALYVSRLVRPIWRSRVTKGTPASPVSNISDTLLMSIQRNLKHLQLFLDEYRQLFNPPTADYGFKTSAPDQEAWKIEQASLGQLRTLVNQTIEAISFILLLADYNMPLTISKVDPELQQALHSLTYEDLLTTQKGKDIARSLVNAIINQQIGQQISVDAISEVLQQQCGSFCSADDVMLYKAMEHVRKAKETADTREQVSCLEQSLVLFGKGVRNTTLTKLQSICLDYRELRFPYGIVQLALKCAEQWDLTNQGQAYFDAGLQPGDPRAEQYEKRVQCYTCITEALGWFLDQETEAEKAGKLDLVRGWRTACDHTFEASLASEDFVFHCHFYDWFASRGNTEVLLEVKSPFVEMYLQHEPRTLDKFELLWQLYVKQGLFVQAAQILAQLSESHQFNLPLEKRIEYLSLAVGNAKSNGATYGRQEAVGEFLTDLEDKLEVGNVQLEILSHLRSRLENPDQDPGLQRLEGEMLNITELYQDFAEPNQMHEMKLLILHTSDHRDPTLVADTWRAVRDREQSRSGDKFQSLGNVVSELGRRFYPSEVAYPIDFLSEMLEAFAIEHGIDAPPGWAPRVLAQGNVPREIVLDYFHNLKESGVPPYQNPVAIQHILTDIVTFIEEWLAEALRPGGRSHQAAFAAEKVDIIASRYLGSVQISGSEAADHIRKRLLDIQTKVRSRF